MSDWIINESNEVLAGDGFYISYNPDTTSNHIFTELGNMLGEELVDGEETALVKKESPKLFYILTGDFRKQYEKLVPQGFDACYTFFKQMQPEHGNNWTTNEEDRP